MRRKTQETLRLILGILEELGTASPGVLGELREIARGIVERERRNGNGELGIENIEGAVGIVLRRIEDWGDEGPREFVTKYLESLLLEIRKDRQDATDM